MNSWFYFSHFVIDIYNAMLNPLMPYITENLKISMAQGAIILSFSYICAALLQPIFGFFADKLNNRSFMFLGLLLAAIFVPCTVLAPSAGILVLFVILGALGISFYHPQALSCVVKKAGIFITAGSLGYAFAPLISSNMMKYFGIKSVVLLSILGLITAILMFKFTKKFRPCQKQKINFIKIFKNSNIRNLTLIAIGKGVNTCAACILLPFYWKSKGMDITYTGTILFLFFFLGGFGSTFSDKIKSKIGLRNIFYLALCGVWLMMMIFFATIKNPILSGFSFVIIGFITMMLVPVNIQLAQYALPEYKSVSAGIINGFSFGVSNLVVMGIAPLAQHFGILKVLFAVAFIPLICCVFAHNLLLKQDA